MQCIAKARSGALSMQRASSKNLLELPYQHSNGR